MQRWRRRWLILSSNGKHSAWSLAVAKLLLRDLDQVFNFTIPTFRRTKRKLRIKSYQQPIRITCKLDELLLLSGVWCHLNFVVKSMSYADYNHRSPKLYTTVDGRRCIHHSPHHFIAWKRPNLLQVRPEQTRLIHSPGARGAQYRKCSARLRTTSNTRDP